ncbi:MAG: hypothetical protein ACE5OP_13595 [Candidatus Glassbacteria bacterium]
MNLEFEKALQKKRIVKFPAGKKQVKRKMEAAEEDLREARD